MDYEKLGLKMGLEIHQQLNTDEKLFCPCECNLTDKKPQLKILRNLRPTQSELGKIDRAAFEESRRELKFIYESYNQHTCLVEADEEPPQPLNLVALEISLIIASLVNMQIVDEFHIMRKQVIDGSNTGGFQRTGLVATNGYLETDYGKVIIDNLCLEEDAARRMHEEKGKTIFRLDRLGIPLVEITTDPSIHHPQQVKEVAYQIGQILRSTKVKRGLGTIRQDLNISINEGARVEIKGVQDLDLMPKMVENEVKRQVNLLEIKDELLKRGASIENEIFDVKEVFIDTESNIVSYALSKGGCVLAIKLNGFNGLIGRYIQPNRRFGTELAGYAKKMGVSGIFHTDELPSYGITQEEVDDVTKIIGALPGDSFIMVADEDKKARNALLEVQRRAKTALRHIPEETRKALEDGNSEYLRPLPTSSRMYVETDIPAICISRKYIEKIENNLPELPSEKKNRIIAKYGLSEDLATQLVKNDKVDDFEKLEAVFNLDSTIIASTLAYTIKELKREGLNVDILDLIVLEEVFSYINRNKIPTASITAVLRSVAKNRYSVREAVKNEGLEKLSNEEVEMIIDDVLSSNNEIIIQRGMTAMGPLMGIVMKSLKGKADGKLVNKLLKDKLIKLIN
ncbi:MAG: Glu-tRNA(Gln) amidotransferase subunit GatE [Methanobacterium sp.]|jgi:glutamyl-tRNA(Gln) amidotransferase subunit E